MLCKTRLMAKEFFRNTFFDVLLICALGYLCSVGWHTRYFPSSTHAIATELSIELLSVSPYIGLAVFMIISYEFTGRSRAISLYEAFDSHRGGAAGTLSAQLGLLAMLAVLFWMVVCSLCVERLWYTGFLGSPLTGNALLASVLYGLLPALAGIFIGAAGQAVSGRVGFYAFLAFSVFFASDMGETIYLTAQHRIREQFGFNAGVAVQRFLDLWHCLMPEHRSGMMETSYGLGIEPFHWAIALMWCLLPLAVLLWCQRGKSMKVMAALCLCPGMICAGGALTQGSNWNRLIGTLDHQDEYSYYESLPNRLDAYVEPEKADFYVTACDMELGFFFQMNADVRLTLDGTYQDEYLFTLYHTLQISKITDGNGNALSFLQDGDYVTVHNPGASPLTQLRFIYSGWRSTDYPMSAQGIFLPGYFCYYPVEGRRAVKDGHVIYAYNEQLPIRQFQVRVSTMCPVLTNLPAGGDGVFTGEASDLSIFGGQYIEKEQDGVRYIMAWNGHTEEWLSYMTHEVERLNESWGLDIPTPEYSTVAITGSVGGITNSAISAYNDTLYVYAWNPANSQELLYAHLRNCLAMSSDNSPVKQWALAILRSFSNGDDTGMGPFRSAFGSSVPLRYVTPQGASEEEDAYRRTGYEIYRAIDETSVQEVMQKIYAYLVAGGGEDEVFIQSLKEM